MFLRALAAFLVLPGIAAGLLPPVLAEFDPWRGDGISLGLVVLSMGVFVLLWCVRDFYISGKGTLAPWDPPKKLVIVGLYRINRNPMYVGVLLIIAGWSLWRASPVLAAYWVLMATVFHLRVTRIEEPWLAQQFNSEWENYASQVHRWIPRLSSLRD